MPSSPSERLTITIGWLCDVVAASIERPTMNKPGLAGPLIMPIWARLKASPPASSVSPP